VYDESAALYSSPLLPSVLKLTDPDRLVRHLFDHLAMASTNEQNTIQNVLVPQRNVVQMQQYISGFWLERSQSVAEAEGLHLQYLDRIAFVDDAYGDCKQGQGSQTEMGNIFLRFGQPNTVVKRHNETDYYPYEIWHYHKAGRFNNKRFLFFAPHVVSECFEMLHSDMLGERQNEDWLSQLRSRENRLRVTESMQNRLNPRDSFSRTEPEDLFYNPR
jgi:GWxTD domain-containing protein